MNVELLRKILTPVFQRYGITCCYLFGSRAGSDFYSDSDLDLAVLFKDFSNAKHDLTLEIEIHDIISNILKPLEVDFLFLQKTPIYLKYSIIKNGKVIFCDNEDFRTDFEDITLRNYLDFQPVLELYYREMAESIVGKQISGAGHD